MNAAVGFDVGGTYVKLGRLDERGNVADERSVRTPLEDSAEALPDLVRAILHEWKDRLPPTVPVGVAVAGFLDDAGFLHAAPNLRPWSETPMRSILERELDRPVVVLNDANAFTLAEGRIGVGKGCRSVVGVAVGTGVGGGLLFDGSLWTGARGFAGEIGHVAVSRGGPRCACGRRGCLEAWVGTTALRRRYAQLRTSGGSGASAPLPGGRDPAGLELSPQEIHERALAGDPAARRTFEEAGVVLGVGLAALAHVIDPEMIVVGGGVGQAGELLLEPARRSFDAWILHDADDRPTIAAAALGPSAGWIGAALAAARSGEGRPE